MQTGVGQYSEQEYKTRPLQNAAYYVENILEEVRLSRIVYKDLIMYQCSWTISVNGWVDQI